MTRSRSVIWSGAVSLLLLSPGCMQDAEPETSKEEARQHKGKSDDGADLCTLLGWYGDDVCDVFCPEPDPDCASCPELGDPGVHYVSTDPAECALITFDCVWADQEPFSDDCGCGCVVDDSFECPVPGSPGVDYISQDPYECAALDFLCVEDDQVPFDNACGCGCLSESPVTCPDPDDPAVHYIGDSHENPDLCMIVDFACDEDQTGFSDECGCGCIDDEPGECPDPDDPKVHYIGDSYNNPAMCGVILFGCEPDQELFTDDCGCGCIDP